MRAAGRFAPLAGHALEGGAQGTHPATCAVSTSLGTAADRVTCEAPPDVVPVISQVSSLGEDGIGTR